MSKSIETIKAENARIAEIMRNAHELDNKKQTIEKSEKDNINTILNSDMNTEESVYSCIEFSAIVTHCVLNKLLEVSGRTSVLLTEYKRDVVTFMTYLKAVRTGVFTFERVEKENTELNTNCKIEIEYKETDAEKDIWNRLYIGQSFGEGVDLVLVAYVALMENYKSGINPDTGNYDITTPYKFFELNRRVVRLTDEKPLFREVEKSTLQLMFSAVRSYIHENSNSSICGRGQYSYLSEFEQDENGTEHEYFRRLPKNFSVDGGIQNTFNESYLLYSATETGTMTVYELIDKLELTKRQREVLELRLRGLGTKAIGKRLGVSYQYAQKCLKQIQKKVERVPELLGVWNTLKPCEKSAIVSGYSDHVKKSRKKGTQADTNEYNRAVYSEQAARVKTRHSLDSDALENQRVKSAERIAEATTAKAEAEAEAIARFDVDIKAEATAKAEAEATAKAEAEAAKAAKAAREKLLIDTMLHDIVEAEAEASRARYLFTKYGRALVWKHSVKCAAKAAKARDDYYSYMTATARAEAEATARAEAEATAKAEAKYKTVCNQYFKPNKPSNDRYSFYIGLYRKYGNESYLKAAEKIASYGKK